MNIRNDNKSQAYICKGWRPIYYGSLNIHTVTSAPEAHPSVGVLKQKVEIPLCGK